MEAGIICFLVSFALLMMGVPIAYGLGAVSVLTGLIYFGPGALDLVGRTTFYFLFREALIPLTLFFFMASILAETSIGADVYEAARKWVGRVPGGLVAASIFGEAAMAAVMGHSGGCIISVGKIAEPEFRRYGYDRSFALGALCTGGVLGPLIPPSITMLILPLLYDVSLARLFIGGIVPGILLAIILAFVAIFLSVRNPRLGPPSERFSWKEKLLALRGVWSVLLLMVCLLGSIYLGLATPTEAAGIGCFLSLLLAVLFYGFRFEQFKKAIMEAARINGFVLFVVVSAAYFTYLVASSGLGRAIADFVVHMGLTRMKFVIILNIIYLIMGCFMDNIAILLLTVPMFASTIKALEIDPIWFGIVVLVNVQIGLITPPFGLDLYLVSKTFNISTRDLLRGVLPFLIACIFFLAVLILLPDIATWLPRRMSGR